jgi:hypothetical protein
MSKGSYIELDRRFEVISKNRDISDEAFDYSNFVNSFEGVGWEKLLEKPRVVILAEAGAGKTWEIKAAAEKLRSSNKAAFFVRLEMIESSLDEAFDLGTISEFSDWLNGNDKGWFFLDSVDEARLVSVRQFELAITRFANRLGDAKQRAHVYITSRVTEWRPNTDFVLIQSKLGFFEPLLETNSNGTTENVTLGAQSTSPESLKKDRKDRVQVEPEVFALKPMNLEQVRKFALAKSTHDLDGFVLEVQRTDSLVFASRPLDLEELIQFWNKHTRIGRRRELLEANIATRLEERDPARASLSSLSADEALRGAK